MEAECYLPSLKHCFFSHSLYCWVWDFFLPYFGHFQWEIIDRSFWRPRLLIGMECRVPLSFFFFFFSWSIMVSFSSVFKYAGRWWKGDVRSVWSALLCRGRYSYCVCLLTLGKILCPSALLTDSLNQSVLWVQNKLSNRHCFWGSSGVNRSAVDNFFQNVTPSSIYWNVFCTVFEEIRDAHCMYVWCPLVIHWHRQPGWRGEVGKSGNCPRCRHIWGPEITTESDSKEEETKLRFSETGRRNPT